MKKAKVYRKNGQVNIRTVLTKEETVNEREMTLFNAKLIRGLMHPIWDTPKQITYVAPNGISLAQYMKRPLTKNDFFLILVQTIEVTKKIESHGFLYNGLLMNYSYIFVNEMSKEVSFIYQPIMTRVISPSIFIFFYDLIEKVKFVPGEDTSFLPGLLEFIHKMQFYTPEELENYVVQIYPVIYQQIQRQPVGQSEDLYSRRLSFEVARAELQKNPQPVMNAAPVVNATPDLETTLLSGEEEGTTLLLDEGTTLLGPEDDMATTLLVEPVATIKRPYLIRTLSGQRYDINQVEYKIGKDGRVVNLMIADNKAVSREHATIRTRGDSYYLIDNHSTNLSFLNGNRLTADIEYAIVDGDSIMLANEGFEFHID